MGVEHWICSQAVGVFEKRLRHGADSNDFDGRCVFLQKELQFTFYIQKVARDLQGFLDVG